DRAFIVPAPAGVQIDGDLSDWDRSAALEGAFDEALRPRFTFTPAFMHDAEALYIGAHFVDDTPLVNRHDPAVEPDRGWDGDCLQVRLSSDPGQPYPLPDSKGDHICHLTIWHYTDARLPVLQLQYGMDYHGTRVLTGAESGVAFRADEDGKGYTLEARVPWGLLNAGEHPPKPGDRIALVAQPLWGDGSGWKNVLTFNEVIRQAGFSFQGCGMWGQGLLLDHGNLRPEERIASPAQQRAPLTLRVPVPAGAQSLSLGVFSETELVRTLPVVSFGAPSDGGEVEVRWDGLDDFGKPLPPGQYTVRFLTHAGVGQRHVTSVHSAGSPPWRTDDGRGAWGGDHGPPVAAAADAERLYLGWTVSEAGWAVIAVARELTADGKPRKLWGQHQVLELGILVTALATNGEVVFVAQDGKGWGADPMTAPNKAGVVLWEAKTGKPVNFPFGQRTLVLSEWSDALKPGGMTFLERASQYHPTVTKKRTWECFAQHDHGPNGLGLNLLGLAVIGDAVYGSLNLEDKIVGVNWRTGERLGEFAVPDPVGLAATPQGQLIVVSGRSVVRVDPASGEVTPIAQDALTQPWGLALDGDGRIYVSDCGDQMQVKVFDANGKPLRALGKPGGRPWVGRYDPSGMLMPAGLTVVGDTVWVCEHDDTPRRISLWSRDGRQRTELLGPGAYAVEGLVDGARPERVNVHNTLFEVDYRTGAVKTLSTLIRPQMTGFQFAPDGGYMGRALHYRHVNGREYVVQPSRGGMLVYLVESDIAEPVAAVGDGNALLLHGFVKSDLPEAVREELWRNPRAFAYVWTDRDGDHLVQEPELAIEPVPHFWGHYWGGWADEDLTLWGATENHLGLLYRVPVTGWTEHGAPIYPTPTAQQALFEVQGKGHVHSVLPLNGSVHVLEQAGGGAYGEGAAWSAVSRYTAEGRREWAYRNVWLGFGLEAPLAKPGDVVGAMKFIGDAPLPDGTDALAVNGYFGQFNLLSSEGLWLASLCHDNRYGPLASETTVWPENFSGCFFRHPESGRYYLIAGDTDCRIWEVTGLEGVRHGRVPLTLTAEDAGKALEAAKSRQGLVSDRPPIRLTRAEVKVDGDLGDWPADRLVDLDAPEGRASRAGIAYDAERLYAAFQVTDDSPMANAGDDEALLFKTGDACELFLATGPNADPHRTRPVAGDVRLILSVLSGEPVCVLFQPVRAQGDHQP
ncbi:MAG: hypothetical protein FJX74_18235, partial [Armatimonadetes bacterium]|nr:hypothetical protein [Armatimonadota bacterium]